MKNILSIVALLVLLTVPSFASASAYYTLEGTVGAIQDRGGLASAAGISVGDTVRYVVEIDTERTGFYTGWNGQDHEVRGSYYASLFSGNLNGVTSKNHNYFSSGKIGYLVSAGNEKSYLSFGDLFSSGELTLGSNVGLLYESSFSGGSSFSKSTQLLATNLKVTNISNVAPTPIPGAVLLMLGGLGVVGFVRRKLS
ncbi:hypothetical protein [Maridesulfovibrio sp.]|uniref:hypothetical protein n=1 Tax=unclassified Maridesulfovibrio TaxID=2794999 RepID=UPI003B000C45